MNNGAKESCHCGNPLQLNGNLFESWSQEA